MILQGEIYKVKCPHCKTITEANRLTPFAVKLKCLTCEQWVEEEAIVSFAYASMLDDDEEDVKHSVREYLGSLHDLGSIPTAGMS